MALFANALSGRGGLPPSTQRPFTPPPAMPPGDPAIPTSGGPDAGLPITRVPPDSRRYIGPGSPNANPNGGPFQSFTPPGRRTNPGGGFRGRGPFGNVFGRLLRSGVLGRGSLMAPEDEDVAGVGSAMAPDMQQILTMLRGGQGGQGGQGGY